MFFYILQNIASKYSEFDRIKKLNQMQRHEISFERIIVYSNLTIWEEICVWF